MLDPYKEGYYYLMTNGCIRYMSSNTAEVDGGLEYITSNIKIIKYWYVTTPSEFEKMLLEANRLDEYINEQRNYQKHGEI
jgi:hypothetical protein